MELSLQCPTVFGRGEANATETPANKIRLTGWSNRGASRRILTRVLEGKIRILISVPLVLDAVVSVAEPVSFRFLWADWLVTFNVRHLRAAAREFGIQTVTPPEAWKEIRKNEKK